MTSYLQILKAIYIYLSNNHCNKQKYWNERYLFEQTFISFLSMGGDSGEMQIKEIKN